MTRLPPGQWLNVGSGEDEALDKKGLIYQVPRIVFHNQQEKKIDLIHLLKVRNAFKPFQRQPYEMAKHIKAIADELFKCV